MSKKYYVITPNVLAKLAMTALELQRQKEAESFTCHVRLEKEKLPKCIRDAWA